MGAESDRRNVGLAARAEKDPTPHGEVTQGGEVLDLFAGPGGWDVAARALGIDSLGIEFDDAACATRAAAGLRTIKADVATTVIAEDAELWGLIASPPCQTFSMAGKGAGREALDDVLLAVDLTARGLLICEFDDPRTALVVQPLRYALLYEPEWIAWEQVPTVLPVWQECAAVLRAEGYDVWAGNLHAEQYGVPQTRKRAVLLASRVREVAPPKPTHSRYYPRTPSKLDTGVAKWVSMAEALGCEADGSMRSNYGTGGDPRNRGMRELSQPAPAITTSKIDRNRWQRRNSGPRASRDPRPITEPSYTIRANGSGSHPSGVEWSVDGDRERVSVSEAAILQSFPGDFPWQGPATKQYQQVGNAIPPLLALHALAEVTGIAITQSDGVAA